MNFSLIVLGIIVRRPSNPSSDIQRKLEVSVRNRTFASVGGDEARGVGNIPALKTFSRCGILPEEQTPLLGVSLIPSGGGSFTPY